MSSANRARLSFSANRAWAAALQKDSTITIETYKQAGVDIDAGNALVSAIKPLARSTARRGANAVLGGFGAFFDLKAAGFADPLLVATTDGVGTKLKLAIATGLHDRIGIDLVAMCVNDVAVQGAEPLFFLDYYATGKLDTATARAIVSSIAEGCREAGCALVGGETAEMPGLYNEGDYDLAGFCVGAVERERAIDGRKVAAGDCVLGLLSSGVHANGYSLVRRLLADLDLKAPAPFAERTSLGAALLTPTKIYVRSCLALAKAVEVKAFAHITGGGLIENIPRILPDNVSVVLQGARWQAPPVFGWLAGHGIAELEMARTFNCGIGMIAVVARADRDRALAILSAAGEQAVDIGQIETAKANKPRVTIEGLARSWQS